MNEDPFERLSIDLESALTQLTATTRARLDGIDVVLPHVDAASLVRQRAQAQEPPAVVHAGPPRAGVPPVRVRREVRSATTRTVVPDATAVVDAPAVTSPAERAVEPVPEREETRTRVPVTAGSGSGGPVPTPPPPPLPPDPVTLPEPAAAAPRGRRRRVAVAAIALSAVVVVAGGYLASRPADPPAATSPSQGVSLPAAPASAPDPGRLVQVAPRSDGSVEVTQWLSFDTPVRSVEVAAPTSRRESRRLTTASVEGRGAATVRLAGAQAAQLVTFSAETDRVRMTYTVSDAVDRSEQDRQRALVDLTAVSIGSQGSDAGETVLRVAGADVRGVACGRTLRTIRPCGSERGRGWALETPSVDSTVVLATVDMDD